MSPNTKGLIVPHMFSHTSAISCCCYIWHVYTRDRHKLNTQIQYKWQNKQIYQAENSRTLTYCKSKGAHIYYQWHIHAGHRNCLNEWLLQFHINKTMKAKRDLDKRERKENAEIKNDKEILKCSETGSKLKRLKFLSSENRSRKGLMYFFLQGGVPVSLKGLYTTWYEVLSWSRFGV